MMVCNLSQNMHVGYSCYINKVSCVRLIHHFYALGMEDFIVPFLIKIEDIAHRWLANKGGKWSNDESAASELWGGFEQSLCSSVPEHWQTSQENINLKDPPSNGKWLVEGSMDKWVFLDIWIISCL
jgi:hypothetical protein